MADLTCVKCGRTMKDTNFYQYKDDSKCELCKPCLTMHVNNWEPETYTWILKKFDVPYIPQEWNTLRDRAYQKNPAKMNGMSVVGKYLSKMKLKQWKGKTWADTEVLAAKAAANQKMAEENAAAYNKERIADMEEAYHNGEISKAQYMTYKELNAPEPQFAMVDGAVVSTTDPAATAQQMASPYEQVDLPDIGNELTTEDKIYLATKWGQLYSASDWVYLEKKYNDFMESFDIQGAARLDTLIQICKLSLKLNLALDSNDMESYSKLVRAYDTLMKSAKFTQSQNDDGESSKFDSVGTIVAFCEKEGGFIPEYKIEAPRDVIDTIIQDNREYLDTLIHNDANLSQQIEQFLQKREILEQQKQDKERTKELGKEYEELTDKDFEDRISAINSELDKDEFLQYDSKIDIEVEDY